MRIYFCHSKKIDYKKLYQLIKESDLYKKHIFIFPHENDNETFNTKTVIKESDLIIAEVSENGIGLGIELGWADSYDTTILSIYNENCTPSNSLKFICNHFISYGDERSFINNLSEFINKNF